MNVDDRDVVRYLRYFTLLSLEEVVEQEEALADRPHERAAHRALAEDVTRRVHGGDGLSSAQRATTVLFGGDMTGLGADEIAEIFSDVLSVDIPKVELEGEGVGVLDLLCRAAVTKSRGEARRAVEGGGVYVNNLRVQDVNATVGSGDAVDGRFIVLRKGKKHYRLVRLL